MRRHVRAKVMARNIRPSAPPLAAATRRHLVNLYHDDVLQLGALIGRDLSRWLAT
jgi:hypothetical protein